uniref:Transmembrane protein n=1 Tax=Heterorhabditis bacteriophora TaxID=37862 RepID=A0A1I7X2I3_HETBA
MLKCIFFLYIYIYYYFFNDIQAATTWHSGPAGLESPVSWPLPQFYLQAPTTVNGSTTSSLRAPSLNPASQEPDLRSVLGLCLKGSIIQKTTSIYGSYGDVRAKLIENVGQKSHNCRVYIVVLDVVYFRHRGELDMAEKYNYDLSKAQLKASSRTSALLAGFAMVQKNDSTYLRFYIDLSWLFSTCIGLLLFLVEVGIIFFVKFDAVGYRVAGYITTAMLIPVVVVFVVFSYLIHKSRVSHSLGRFKDKVWKVRLSFTEYLYQ